MEEVPVFVLAVAIAVAAMMVMAALLYVESKPVLVAAPYFAVRPGPSSAVNVSVADFYARPEGAYWYVDGQFAGYGWWVLAPCGANVTAVVLYPGATRSISGVIACTKPFTPPPPNVQFNATAFLNRASQAADAMFQGELKGSVSFGIPDPCYYPWYPPLGTGLTLYTTGGIWLQPNGVLQLHVDIPCDPDLVSGVCYYRYTYREIVYVLMPWAQGGDVVPFEITLNVYATGRAYTFTHGDSVQGSYTLNITNLITGQSFISSFSGVLASAVCETFGYVNSGTTTFQKSIYPNCTKEWGIQGVFSGSNTQYGVVEFCASDNGQIYYTTETGGELSFTAKNATISVTPLGNGAAQITYPDPNTSQPVTVTAQQWGPIGYQNITTHWTYYGELFISYVFPTNHGYYYSLYPFQAPVLAFTDHDPAAGPKYAPIATGQQTPVSTTTTTKSSSTATTTTSLPPGCTATTIAGYPVIYCMPTTSSPGGGLVT